MATIDNHRGAAGVDALEEFGLPLDDPAETYHESSKLHPSLLRRQMAGVRRLERSPAWQRTVRRAGKRYPHRPACPLPPPRLPGVSFEAALRARRSQRPSAIAPVSLEALSALLFAAYGVTRGATETHPDLRAAPSAGALYPLDVYVAAQRVEGLPRGLHHYDPTRHLLAYLRDEDPGPHLSDVLVDPSLDPALFIILMASFQRSRFKYGPRGFRFTLLEAGHVAQNVLLAAAVLHLAALPLGGYFDRRLDDYLRIDGVYESAVYLVAVGAGAEEAKG